MLVVLHYLLVRIAMLNCDTFLSGQIQTQWRNFVMTARVTAQFFEMAAFLCVAEWRYWLNYETLTLCDFTQYRLGSCWIRFHIYRQQASIAQSAAMLFISIANTPFTRHNGCQTGRQTGLTTGWMFVYTIQPVVKPVWKPVWQQVVSCKRGLTTQRTSAKTGTDAVIIEGPKYQKCRSFKA